jgi:hypothetical protein
MGELNFKLSRHVREEIERRSIPLNLLRSVLESPQQVVSERGGKKAYQSQLDFGGGKILLLRAIVDETVDPPIVVTAYRTSKITKYWRTV